MEINKRVRQYTFIVLLILIVVLVGSMVVQYSRTSSPFEQKVKHILSVQVEKGDTLWGIAQRYKTEEYEDIRHYIKEIKICNGMKDDNIHEGSYLIIPYYKDSLSEESISLTSE